MLPRAMIVELPNEVGEGGGASDFFVTLGRTKDEFERLLKGAVVTPPTDLPLQPELPNAKVPAPDSTSRLDRIKRALPIEAFISRYVELRSSAIGTALRGQCPFHNERFESLAVFPRIGMYYCYECRARGDVIAFLAAKEDISFNEAVDKLDQIITNNGEPTRANNQQNKAA